MLGMTKSIIKIMPLFFRKCLLLLLIISYTYGSTQEAQLTSDAINYSIIYNVEGLEAGARGNLGRAKDNFLLALT